MKLKVVRMTKMLNSISFETLVKASSAPGSPRIRRVLVKELKITVDWTESRTFANLHAPFVLVTMMIHFLLKWSIVRRTRLVVGSLAIRRIVRNALKDIVLESLMMVLWWMLAPRVVDYASKEGEKKWRIGKKGEEDKRKSRCYSTVASIIDMSGRWIE